jgi:hypothetical protein
MASPSRAGSSPEAEHAAPGRERLETTMQIYWFKAQAPLRVLALAKHLGIEAETIEVDLIPAWSDPWPPSRYALR